jgi:sugar lactone lactonase YvrE
MPHVGMVGRAVANAGLRCESKDVMKPGSHKRMVILLSVLILAGSTQSYAIDKARYRELFQKLSEAAKQKNWQGARDVLTEIGRELPAPTPRYMLSVATIETRLGHKVEALKWIEKYVATGLSFDSSKDEDLKALMAAGTGEKVAALMKEHSRPVTNAEFVCTLPQADTMPEDIAYLKATNAQSAGSFYVSSIQHHTAYRVSLPKTGSRECTMEELPLSPEAKRWPTLAVAADPKRNVLWVTASAMPGFSGFPKQDEGKAVLIEIDPRSGRVLRRFDPATTGPAVLGDMCVTDQGTVYVTDSIGGGVYRLDGDLQTAKLEKIADGLFSPQTPVLSRDGKRLFVADYTMGIAVIDLPAAGAAPNPSAKLNYLPHPENVAVVGLDGLYRNGDSLIGIQNGTEAERIMYFPMNPAQTEITGAQVIHQIGRFDPTHAVEVDGWFYATSNVGWNKVDDNTGQLKPGEKFTPPVLLRFSQASPWHSKQPAK